MANFEFDSSSMDQLIRSMEKLDLFEADTQDEMLNAQADVLIDAIQGNMAAAPFAMEEISRNVSKSKVTKSAVPSITVTVKGRNAHGERNATVAFVLNYGRKKEFGEIVGTYYWTRAAEQAKSEMLNVGEEIATKKLKERGLI